MDVAKVRVVIVSRPRSLFAYAGYKTYGIISHQFLKHYRWTIDFDNRVFFFEP